MENIMSKSVFIHKCGELLHVAKSNLISCELKLGKEILENKFETYLSDDEYVLVTCENGYQYVLPIEGNSLCSIAETIFRSMMHK